MDCVPTLYFCEIHTATHARLQRYSGHVIQSIRSPRGEKRKRDELEIESMMGYDKI